MFHHVKDLQFNARVSEPDPRFAGLLLEQFGGPNGELKAAMQYFVQAFGCRRTYPMKYDMLMDIATEEFSHLEIVGATITMLLDGINGELKNAVEKCTLASIMKGKSEREQMLHEATINPEFLVLTGGGPVVTNAGGTPWSSMYIESQGDLTIDLRSNIAAESRAKIVYEYLIQFTDDPLVKETLNFLMTREVAHFQQFSAALDTIEPNFPPGVLQGDPRFSNVYFNMSTGESSRGPWNEGQIPLAPNEQWVYVEDPITQVSQTRGQSEIGVSNSPRTIEDTQRANELLSNQWSSEIKKAMPKGEQTWSTYAAPVSRA